jgi:hypothetical protein
VLKKIDSAEAKKIISRRRGQLFGRLALVNGLRSSAADKSDVMKVRF